MLPQFRDAGAGQGKGVLAGLNQRWRLYKYSEGDIFRPHTDGDWPGSKMSDDGSRIVQDAFGDRWSQMTMVLYLNYDFEGGATRFYAPASPGSNSYAAVAETKPIEGAALIFHHGQHPASPLHEGCVVTSGTKYIVRTDVLYTFQ